MRLNNKIKSRVLVILGVFLIIFVFKFDALAGKPVDFGIHSAIALIAGAVSIFNGIRVYKRK